MEDLLQPDYGVMVLTVCNFLLLVYLLKKFAWNGIIGMLEKRERQIADDKQQAQEARVSAENIKRELDEKLAQISAEAAKRVSEAVKLGETQRDQILAEAKEQAQRLANQAAAQIQAEKDQALADVREEIVRTAVLAASKVVGQQMNEASARETVDRVLAEVKAK